MLHKQDKCQSSARTEGCRSPGAVDLVLLWQLCPLTQSLAGPWVGSVWQSGHPLSSLKAGAHLAPLCGEVTQNSCVCQCSPAESWDEFLFHSTKAVLGSPCRKQHVLALWGGFTVSPPDKCAAETFRSWQCSSLFQARAGPREPLAEQIMALQAQWLSWFVKPYCWMESACVRRLIISGTANKE